MISMPRKPLTGTGAGCSNGDNGFGMLPTLGVLPLLVTEALPPAEARRALWPCWEWWWWCSDLEWRMPPVEWDISLRCPTSGLLWLCTWLRPPVSTRMPVPPPSLGALAVVVVPAPSSLVSLS